MYYGNARKAERERQRKQATELAGIAVLAAVHSGAEVARQAAAPAGATIPRQRGDGEPPRDPGPST